MCFISDDDNPEDEEQFEEDDQMQQISVEFDVKAFRQSLKSDKYFDG